MSRLLVSAYSIGHDSNLSFYDIDKGEFFYIKFERLNNIKHYAANQHEEWLTYLFDYFHYSPRDVKDICFVEAPGYNNFFYSPNVNNIEIKYLDHHLAHLYSTNLFNSNNFSGIIYDGSGSQSENMSIYNKELKTITYCNKTHPSLGLIYNNIFNDLGITRYDAITQGWQRANGLQTDIAGKVMALDAYGHFLPKWQEDYKNMSIKNIQQYGRIHDFYKNVYKWTEEKDEFKLQASLVKNLTHKVSEELLTLLKLNFNTLDTFSFSGGVAQNLILNNKFKQNFPNLEIYPHVGDEGLSLGGLKFLLDLHGYGKEKIFERSKFPFIQCDENMGTASSKTIKNIAEELAKGKVVLWCQEQGELGPRALGNRSILMNPAIVDAKEQINKRVKNREWYRPYAASVKEDSYQDYFDLPWKSPYMLYQAQVKDPQKFKAITHADGTCRIQTVEKNHRIFYELLDEFEKLTGFPILLNTSLNLPGSPIVGRKEIAIDMFEKSKADILVIGDQIFIKENTND